MELRKSLSARRLPLAPSAPWLLALVLVAVTATAQKSQESQPSPEVHDLTDQEPTFEDLLGALTPDTQPPLRTRGAPEPRCDYFWKQRTRGIEPPAAKVAAVRVLFEFDSAELTQGARESLEELGKALTSNTLAPCCFEIQGHTDGVGAEAYNQHLSERRAEAVVQFLVEGFGIDQKRLLPRGYGESRPLADNDSESGRQKNRRVQIVNLGYGRVDQGSE